MPHSDDRDILDTSDTAALGDALDTAGTGEGLIALADIRLDVAIVKRTPGDKPQTSSYRG